MPEIFSAMMEKKKLSAKAVAEKRGVTQGTLSGVINKPSLALKTLHSIFKAMDEDVVFVLKSGEKFKLKI